MRRFVFTSTKFKGHVEAIYFVDGVLWRIDFSKASGITQQYIFSFKNHIPILAEDVLEAYAPYPIITVEEKEFEVTFEDFKREYPSSRNMYRVEPLWDKNSSSERYLIYIGAIEYKKYFARNASWGYKAMGADRFITDKEYKNKWAEL